MAIIHANKVYCGNSHILESWDINQVNCSVCKHILSTNDTLYETYTTSVDINSPAEQNKIKALDNKIARSKKGLSCNLCLKKMMVKKNSKTGENFFGCTGYPRCKNTMPDSIQNRIKHRNKK